MKMWQGVEILSSLQSFVEIQVNHKSQIYYLECRVAYSQMFRELH